MLEALLEFFVELLGIGATDGPRWMRIGCATIMLVILGGILAFVLWPRG